MHAFSLLEQKRPSQLVNPEGNGRPILFVEDNPMDIDLTIQALLDTGVVNPIVVCRDGEEAMQFIRSYNVPACMELPLLILLDLRLPRITGLELLSYIKKDQVWKTVPVTILTTSSDDTDLKAAYALGANSYIVKPVDSEAFQAVAHRIQLYWIATNRNAPAEPRKSS